MPFSAGGGSAGGGFHGGSSFSGGSSSHSSGPLSSKDNSSSSQSPYLYGGISYMKAPKTRRFVYYTNKKPEYIYCKGDLSKPYTTRLFFLFLLIPVLAVSLFFTVGIPHKLTGFTDSAIHINDKAGIIKDEETLVSSLESFRNKTGITPCIVTVFSDSTKAYDSLEDFALEYYRRWFDDEAHYLIVICAGSDKSHMKDWAWESVAGNNTASILNPKVRKTFNSKLQSGFSDWGMEYSSQVLSKGFNTLTEISLEDKLAFGEHAPVASVFLIMSLFFTVYLIAYDPHRKYKGAVPCDFGTEEKECLNCGGLYAQGTVKKCPYCGQYVFD